MLAIYITYEQTCTQNVSPILFKSLFGLQKDILT